ncbi:hypothetical protein L1967_21005 [Zunongwangia sp. M21534]|uniref:Uncharacterized protein n=1 Tax=Zunongwangia pacifica TaxID=2911062 RepID=A0A9X1ZVP5_9FLAO|nr:hypothetical protein [Zunongwangia pacifica]
MPVPCVQYFLRTGRPGVGGSKKQWAALAIGAQKPAMAVARGRAKRTGRAVIPIAIGRAAWTFCPGGFSAYWMEVVDDFVQVFQVVL